MYGAFDVVLYFVNPTVLVANKLTSYLILYDDESAGTNHCQQLIYLFKHIYSG